MTKKPPNVAIQESLSMGCGALAVLTCLAGLGSGACSRPSDGDSARTAPRASASATEDVIGYPRGTWRVDPDAIRHVLVSYAEILVSYQGAESPRPFPLAVTRSRQEALATARNVASVAQKRPQDFAALAERYSDDSVTRVRGGYAGVLRPAFVTSTVVDALRVLHDGEISHVIESDFGYHVVQRLKVRPDETFSADEIVVQHRAVRSPWTRPGRSIGRTREEAVTEANRLAALARSAPDTFSELVRSSSDAYGAISGGDLGVWSLYAPRPNVEVATAVSRLEMGGIAVVEDIGGVHVLRRKPPTERPWLQSEEIVVTHSSSSLSMGDEPTTRSRHDARTLALHVLGEWKRHPDSYAALASKYCGQYRCKHPRRAWREGSDIPGLDGTIAALRQGELARAPVETPLGFHVVRRVVPAPEETRTDQPFSFEIPDPGPKNADFFFERVSPDVLADATLAFKPIAVQKLGLTGDKAVTFGSILNDLAESLRREPSQKRSVIRGQTQQSLIALLGQADYTRYVEARDAWIKDQQEEM
jgi:hypothetical protein